MKTKIIVGLCLLLLSSCATPKHKTLFLTGEKLDFSKGKWLINTPETNAKRLASSFRITAYDEFRNILGDSLFEIQDLQNNTVFNPEIPFEINDKSLAELNQDINCDYIINIRGTIQHDDIGLLGSSKYNYYTKSTNQTLVEIIIYDIKHQQVISNSEIVGKITDGSNDPTSQNNNRLYFVQQAEKSLIDGLKKLIRKYEKNKL